jgi:leucyl aminopeptidase
MSEAIKLSFSSFGPPAKGVLVVFCDEKLAFGPVVRKALGRAADVVKRVATGEGFKGRKAATLDIAAPAGLDADRLVVIGVGKPGDLKEQDYLRFGGVALGKVPSGLAQATVIAELPGGAMTAEQAADLGLGALMRAYRFDRYKTKKKDGEEKPARASLTVAVKDPAAARKAWSARDALANGVTVARDLVNEPPNILYPEEFARRAGLLKKLGVSVSVLDVKAMRKLGMGALLAVGQGSIRQSRMVVMRWNGAKASAKPVAFIGKGVCFDTGGISIKPAGGMEDMKGDMAGAACVVGLMHALAARKAKVNAIGAIGVVENMPDGNAYRPGDILTSMSGQTIEVINTDAEGRLVLADVLWYVGTKFKPQFMVNLATLTGAILVALGNEYAGLFSNDDALSEKLRAAGEVTGERLWRMPLGPEYDKLIDSKFADVKNTGGRNAGSITAAQFLQRFVPDKTPWAHLDIAGTGMGSPQTDINKSWGSGYGVRLLDRLVRDQYEG